MSAVVSLLRNNFMFDSPQALEVPLSEAEIHANCLEECVSGIRRGHRDRFYCQFSSMCSSGFVTLEELHLHIHKNHLICMLCYGTPALNGVPRYRDVDAYAEHFRTEHRKCVFTDCSRHFPDHNALLQHYKYKHPLRCCLRCRIIPLPKFNNLTIRQVLCKECAVRVFVRAPIMLEIPYGHDVFGDVEERFCKDWSHRSPTPTVIKVWKIFGRKVYVDRYNAYKKQVTQASACINGNARRRWHGTTRKCRLGDDHSVGIICDDPQCSLCRIIETNFDVWKSGTKTGWGRFGRGIYTSSTSSKADSYADESGDSPYRTMLLNAVILGRSLELKRNSPNLREPPAGYESVTGMPGGDLNYDECVVYDNDAIRPMYLVVYRP